ncbi:MAG TPA: hypothetical protein PLD25_31125 [Chloroflexota bacterium]|nr:hypothetical protein [Chloroflexota bacterium]HUM67881.1 hypothetical protein [Chloroflexota bacterium]
MTLYARKIVLRNCGRFTVIQSDFGADYRTHTHVTSEALYASLTRGVTWQPKPIVVKNDADDFVRDYNPSALPIWFTPGIFLDKDGKSQLAQDTFDTAYFNVLHEAYPTTSKSYGYAKTGILEEQSRPHHTPTYGTWQGIKPDNRLFTCAFSPDIRLLEAFTIGQTFLLGKKRTMMQIIHVEEIVEGKAGVGSCTTPFLQVSTTGIALFQSFEVMAGTIKYLIMRGITQPRTKHVQFGEHLAIPVFAIPAYMEYIE